MPETSSQNHIVIIDDSPYCRESISAVVSDHFGEQAQFHMASGAQEALEIIESIESIQDGTTHRIRMALVDLHMSEDGSDNGDVFIATSMERIQRGHASIPTAIVSGTFMDKHKKRLGEIAPMVPFLDKGAFLSTVDPNSVERQALIMNLTAMMAGGLGLLPNSPEYVEAIKNIKASLDDVSKIGSLIDSASFMVSSIWMKYGEYLSTLPEADILKNCSLYERGGEITGKQLHDFKNELPALISALKRRGDCPEGLAEGIVGFHAFLARSINDVMNQRESFNLGVSLRSICDTFNANFGGRLKVNIPSNTPNIAMDPCKFNSIIIELLQNALVHSEGKVLVRILGDNQISITNDAVDSDSPLPFEIADGAVIEGVIPTESNRPGGSAQGLNYVMQLCNDNNVGFDMYGHSFGTIETDLNLGKLVVIDRTPPAPHGKDSAEVAPDHKNVVFMCHDRSPESTFENILGHNVEGFNYYPLEWPSTDGAFNRWLAENSELLKNCSLLVAHIHQQDFEVIVRKIHLSFPHITILPASSAEIPIHSWLEYAEYGMSDFVAAGNIITISDVLETGGLLSEYFHLYCKGYSKEDWGAILNCAHGLALKRIETREE